MEEITDKTFIIDGTTHKIGNDNCCSISNCSICGEKCHTQHTTFGRVRICENCDLDEYEKDYTKQLFHNLEAKLISASDYSSDLSDILKEEKNFLACRSVQRTYELVQQAHALIKPYCK